MTATYHRRGKGHSIRGREARDLGARAWSRLPASLRRGLTSSQAANLQISAEWHHAGKYATEVYVYYPAQVEAFWAAMDTTDWTAEEWADLINDGWIGLSKTDLRMAWAQAREAAETVRSEITGD